MPKQIQFTKEGLEKVRKELEFLKGAERLRIAEAIREAKSHGDLRENAAYHEAKLNQQRLDSRIVDLERALQMAKVVERPAGADDTAYLGSKVTLFDIEFDEELTITLVSTFEADPTNDMISIASPLGESVLGRGPGEEVDVETPNGTMRYRILAVN